MTQRNRILKTLSVILPAGAVGASVLLALGSTDVKAATNAPTAVQRTAGASVSTRLLEIRNAVSDLSGSASDPSASDAKAAPAWWGNGGWGRWRLGWHNGGWGNGGWHNGGWGNGGWHNFWHNW